jgi:hypothetical protein
MRWWLARRVKAYTVRSLVHVYMKNEEWRLDETDDRTMTFCRSSMATSLSSPFRIQDKGKWISSHHVGSLIRRKEAKRKENDMATRRLPSSARHHQSPGYFDHVLELIVIIFKIYFENDQDILTSSSSMGFLPIKLMIIIISSFSIFSFIYFSTFVW